MVAFTGVETATVTQSTPKGPKRQWRSFTLAIRPTLEKDRLNEPEWRRNGDVAANAMNVSARVRKQNLRFNIQLVNMAKIAILGA